MVKKEVWISFPKKVLKSYEFHSSSFLARVNYDLNSNILDWMRSPVDRKGYDGGFFSFQLTLCWFNPTRSPVDREGYDGVFFFFFSTDVMLIQSNPPWTHPSTDKKFQSSSFLPNNSSKKQKIQVCVMSKAKVETFSSEKNKIKQQTTSSMIWKEGTTHTYNKRLTNKQNLYILPEHKYNNTKLALPRRAFGLEGGGVEYYYWG